MYQVSLYLWRMKHVLILCTVPKYYTENCLKTFLSLVLNNDTDFRMHMFWVEDTKSIEKMTPNQS